jgi:hypothetical protein
MIEQAKTDGKLPEPLPPPLPARKSKRGMAILIGAVILEPNQALQSPRRRLGKYRGRSGQPRADKPSNRSRFLEFLLEITQAVGATISDVAAPKK